VEQAELSEFDEKLQGFSSFLNRGKACVKSNKCGEVEIDLIISEHYRLLFRFLLLLYFLLLVLNECEKISEKELVRPVIKEYR